MYYCQTQTVNMGILVEAIVLVRGQSVEISKCDNNEKSAVCDLDCLHLV